MSRKIRTTEELEKMSPAEIDAKFRAGVVWEIEDAPPEIIARTRERILNRIERTESALSPPRRVVRTTYDFFEDLDAQLGRERGPNGEPSTNDFQNIELLRIVSVFAEEFDQLPALLPGREEYRVLIATGRSFRR